jgi:hypothetical protein
MAFRGTVIFDRCRQVPFLLHSTAHWGGGEFAVQFLSLPSRLNLKDFEEQVRRMLDQVRRGDATAFARWYGVDSEARTRQPRKADIQYVIAREHGFKSWQSLRDCCTTTQARKARPFSDPRGFL